MILYATKETFQHLKLKTPEEMQTKHIAMLARAVLDRESKDPFLQWGGKLFYFDRRKCLQVTHFTSRLAFFLVDINVAELDAIGQLIAYYLFDLYQGNKTMMLLIEQLLDDSPVIVFDRLKDRSIIAMLNHTQKDYLNDGYRLYDYLQDGTLHTRKINLDANREWVFAKKIDGKKDYFCSAELFEQQLKERYHGKPIKINKKHVHRGVAGIVESNSHSPLH